MRITDNIRYITDENGSKTAVVVPFEEWKSMSENIEEFEDYISVKSSLSRGLKEAKEIASGKSQAKNLSSFLDEL